MKLTVVVYDNVHFESRDAEDVPYVECVISGCGGDFDDIASGGEQVLTGYIQAEQVARLTEVSRIIREDVKNYYSHENKFPTIKP